MPAQNRESQSAEQQVIPLYTKEIAVSRRKVCTVIQVVTVTHARPTQVNEQLTHKHVEIECVAINRIVDVAPPVREEGNITIIPVVEEIAVVERRILLKEEVRLRKVRMSEQYYKTVVLRDKNAVVTALHWTMVTQHKPSPGTS